MVRRVYSSARITPTVLLQEARTTSEEQAKVIQYMCIYSSGQIKVYDAIVPVSETFSHGFATVSQASAKRYCTGTEHFLNVFQ